MSKKRLYFDMDGVIVDCVSALNLQSEEILKEYEGRLDESEEGYYILAEVGNINKSPGVMIMMTDYWKNS